MKSKLQMLSLERRDVPTAWYAVSLDSPAQGTHGDSSLTVTGGGLSATTAEVWADSPADAVKLAVTGHVVVGGQTYSFSPPTVSGNQTPFVLAPMGTGYEVRLEDLAATPQQADWDYNDTTWAVSVIDYNAPPKPPEPKTPTPPTPDPATKPLAVPAPKSGNDPNGKPYLYPNPEVKPYGRDDRGTPYQRGHLYPQSPFNDWIHPDSGGTIPMYGGTTDPTSQHYQFHYELDQFWDHYRVNGDRFPSVPTLAEYEAALRAALVKMGYTEAEAKRIQEDARKMMDQYRQDLGLPPLKGTDPVPYIPGPTIRKRP